MEKSKLPDVAYSIALDKMKGYATESKAINKKLNMAKQRMAMLKKYVQDIKAGETLSTTSEKMAFSNTREVLDDEISELKHEIEYLSQEEQRLIAFIEHEGARDQYMQERMDNSPSGKA